LQLDARKEEGKPKRNCPSNDSSRPLFLLGEREVMPQQGIFYCLSCQMGLSGVIFAEAGKRENKQKKRKSARTQMKI